MKDSFDFGCQTVSRILNSYFIIFIPILANKNSLLTQSLCVVMFIRLCMCCMDEVSM